MHFLIKVCQAKLLKIIKKYIQPYFHSLMYIMFVTDYPALQVFFLIEPHY